MTRVISPLEGEMSGRTEGGSLTIAMSTSANIAEQEERLVFDRFDEARAFEIGGLIRRRGLAEAMPIVVEIRFWDRLLFYAALPGSTSSNTEWVRRKLNVVKMFHKSTYRMVLEEQRPDRTFKPGAGLSPADFVLAGGRVSDPHQGRRRGWRHRRFGHARARGSRPHRGGSLRTSGGGSREVGAGIVMGCGALPAWVPRPREAGERWPEGPERGTSATLTIPPLRLGCAEPPLPRFAGARNPSWRTA
jgi:uncharacterized protein (UPF0303 family)